MFMRRDGRKLAVEEDGVDGLGLGKGMVESIVVESWSAERYGAKMQTFVRDKQKEYQHARQRWSKTVATCRQEPAQK